MSFPRKRESPAEFILTSKILPIQEICSRGDSRFRGNDSPKLINYNAENVPVTVYFNNGDKLVNNYDMSGNRVRKQFFTGGVSNSDIYYFNSKEGISEVVDLVPYGYNYTYNIWGNDNIGQVRVNGGVFNRYYYLKDHLGSIRVTVNSAGNVDSYDDYYPFGKVMDGRSSILNADTRYKFTSKERDVQTNYDYFGARFYDSRVARWLSVDPLAHKYPGWSPYNYCLNNPLKMLDLDGKAPGDLFKDQRSAAMDWGMLYNGSSIVMDREFGSYIYKINVGGKDYFSYNIPEIGEEHTVTPEFIGEGAEIVADIHSHGAKSENYKDDIFSSKDKESNDLTNTNGYLSTPNGSLLEYNKDTKKVTEISTTLPSDTNDQSRKNTIPAVVLKIPNLNIFNFIK